MKYVLKDKDKNEILKKFGKQQIQKNAYSKSYCREWKMLGVE